MQYSFPCLRAIAILLLCASFAEAQQSRIVRRVDDGERVAMPGDVHPRARAEYDRGRVSPSLKLHSVTLALAPSDEQRAALERLLRDQQDPNSPDYHRWLTPEEYGQRFGASHSDIAQIAAWLESQHLTVNAVGRGRNWIAFEGAALDIERAFQSELHRYEVNGDIHFANATAPSVPAALAPLVQGIRGLNDFRLKPAPHKAMKPDYNSGATHYLAPGDFAAIYDIVPLYNAGFDGSGQKIVVAGQTQIDMADIVQFRSRFNLPVNDPRVMLIPNSIDPGVSSSDLGEADLDVEWAGAVAPRATVLYVYASDVLDAVQYAIDQNLAPVVSESYGLCEAEEPSSAPLMLQSWARQGNAQGITWFAPSGDSGAADCGDAQHPGLSVDVPASIPEVTGVGGTEFVEGGGVYWNTFNDANGASALSYIPEASWNDSARHGEPWATGGGASTIFAKPAWQVGAGVPNDNARHVPDVALTASADHDGYLVYTGGVLETFGGTSAPTPSFAAIAKIGRAHV